MFILGLMPIPILVLSLIPLPMPLLRLIPIPIIILSRIPIPVLILSLIPILVLILNLGHFQVCSYRYRSLIEGLYTLMEALWKPLNSPPVHSLNYSRTPENLESCYPLGLKVRHKGSY